MTTLAVTFKYRHIKPAWFRNNTHRANLLLQKSQHCVH